MRCNKRAGAGRSPFSCVKILVAGVGNVLRGDDGFGVALAQRLLESNVLPPQVTVIEFGIAGVRLVQELLTGYDALVVLDAVDRNTRAGTVHVLEPAVPEIADLPVEQRRDFLSDMHYANPARALIFAKALGALPARVLIVGCQPETCDDLRLTLSPIVEAALPAAVIELQRVIGRWVAA